MLLYVKVGKKYCKLKKRLYLCNVVLEIITAKAKTHFDLMERKLFKQGQQPGNVANYPWSFSQSLRRLTKSKPPGHAFRGVEQQNEKSD